MKYCRLTIVLLVVLLWGSISGGCSQNYAGVWYGLDEDTSPHYDSETDEPSPKLILERDGTCSGDRIDNGRYYISDEALFLEPTNDDLRKLTISNREDGAAALDFVDSGSGTVLIDNDAGDEWDPYIVLYYPTIKMWEDALEKLEERRTEKLKETLISDIWFNENLELSEAYADTIADTIYDLYEFDGYTIYYRTGTYDGSFHYCTNEELVALEDSWNYEVENSMRIEVYDPDEYQRKDSVHCSVSTTEDSLAKLDGIQKEYQTLHLNGYEFDKLDDIYCIKASDYNDWATRSELAKYGEWMNQNQ